MSVCYLDIEDEITSAIGRLRAITDSEAIVVVPPGSRIATSRINFKLLVREAADRHLNIAAVSDEPGVRALAISAGLPAYDSLAAAEAALATFREQDRQLAERLGRPPTDAPAPPAVPASPAAGGPPDAVGLARQPTPAHHPRSVTDTQVMAGGQLPPVAIAGHDAVPGGSGPSGAGPAGAPGSPGPGLATDTAVLTRPTRRRRRRPAIAPLVVLLLLLVLVGTVAYGAYLFLPTASITFTPTATELRPAPFTVTADPNVAVADPVAGVVPAQTVPISVAVSGDFAATGTQVTQAAAHGTVRFRSENTINEVAIPKGTVVSTADGVEFATTDAVIVPRADFSTGTAGTVDVGIKATLAGPRGNVDAAAITELPTALADQLVSVSNLDPTTGGRRTEQAQVAQTDYDSALAALTSQLGAALATAMADPSNTPRGLTMFAATAVLADDQGDPPASTVVGSLVDSFSLTLTATYEVLAVNENLVDDLVATRVRSGLAPDQKLVGDTVAANRSIGEAVGQRIVYQVAPVASVYAEPDPAALVDSVRGKTVSEAREILGRTGMVEIVVWPDFIDRLPDQAARISLNVVAPSGP